MPEDSVFRMLGPIMTGPSSSHTAGAVRIGRTARLLYGKEPKNVVVYFHGSFAETWKGHGSDKAVIGGLLGFKTFDERIKEADKFAKEVGMAVTFERINLGRNYHPNSIKIVVEPNTPESVHLIAESVGGGDIVIREALGYKIEISGENVTIILRHSDFVGTLSKITGGISQYEINIVSLRSKDIPEHKEALTTVEIGQNPPVGLQETLEKIKGMKLVRILPKISEGEEMF
ncbi:MAG: L-serine ammonia-lyase, iron-sulfur-dependent subunit beta [Candidatus Heimdallarchaeota archaeon]|nr:L-serine ammonia-lyase, iron-sulfur-dependent subunit beta [Candidatus Heimdallarchaeota archaeon]